MNADRLMKAIDQRATAFVNLKMGLENWERWKDEPSFKGDQDPIADLVKFWTAWKACDAEVKAAHQELTDWVKAQPVNQ